MIPSDDHIVSLWDVYQIPQNKRRHLQKVANLCDFFSTRMQAKGIQIDQPLLHAAALIHDIDQQVKKKHEPHPMRACMLLHDHHMDELIPIVQTHVLDAICDPKTAPKTIEQKLLFLSDKMTKYDVIGVDARFALWRDEHLPPDQQRVIDIAYPLVKKMEEELCQSIDLTPHDVIQLNQSYA